MWKGWPVGRSAGRGGHLSGSGGQVSQLATPVGLSRHLPDGVLAFGVLVFCFFCFSIFSFFLSFFLSVFLSFFLFFRCDYASL